LAANTDSLGVSTRTPCLIKALRNSRAIGVLVLPVMRKVWKANTTLPRRRKPQALKPSTEAAASQVRRLCNAFNGGEKDIANSSGIR
jgi:hypothetical protein